MADSSNQTILVTRATGTQGDAIARYLLQREFTVRALVRDQNKPAAQALKQAGAELVEDRALQGAWGVFLVQIFHRWLDAEICDGTIANAAKAAGI